MEIDATMELEAHEPPLHIASPPPTTGPAAQRVVTHICALFESGRLRPGDRLPAERALAQAIGVSRPSLRAGLQSLAAVGLIASRRGSGTYVSVGPAGIGGAPRQIMGACQGASWMDLFEARALLELEVADMAARRATPAQLASIAEAARDLTGATGEPLEFLRHDMRFHEAVALATGNPVLGTLVTTVRELFAESRRAAVLRAHDLSRAARLHEEIYLALCSRDPRLARDAVAAHLEHARREYAHEQRATCGEPLEDH